jgi:hypothetical protein
MRCAPFTTLRSPPSRTASGPRAAFVDGFADDVLVEHPAANPPRRMSARRSRRTGREAGTPRDRERAEEERPDEHAVQRQRLIQQMAGEELLRRCAPSVKPSTTPNATLIAMKPAVDHRHRASRSRAIAAVQDEKVDQQQGDKTASTRAPGGDGCGHPAHPRPNGQQHDVTGTASATSRWTWISWAEADGPSEPSRAWTF